MHSILQREACTFRGEGSSNKHVKVANQSHKQRMQHSLSRLSTTKSFGMPCSQHSLHATIQATATEIHAPVILQPTNIDYSRCGQQQSATGHPIPEQTRPSKKVPCPITSHLQGKDETTQIEYQINTHQSETQTGE